MKLFVISDVHVDEWQYSGASLPHSCYPNTHVDVAILAGDIGELKVNATAEYVNSVAESANHVIWIPGNHEYYGRYIGAKPKQSLRHNVHFINNQWLDIEDVRFVCATMWTPISPMYELDVSDRHRGLRDYVKIRTHDYKKLTPRYVTSMHYTSVSIMNDICMSTPDDMQVFVITHHKPFVGKPPYGKIKNTDCAYHVDMIDEMEKWKVRNWVFGHTHESVDLSIDFDTHTTNIISRALGYSMYHNKELDHYVNV